MVHLNKRGQVLEKQNYQNLPRNKKNRQPERMTTLGMIEKDAE